MSGLLKKLLGWVFPLGIPLAWHQLLFTPKRFIAIVISTLIVSLLLLIEVGMYFAVKAQAIRPHKKLNAELFIISKQYKNFYQSGLFSEKRLIQAAASKYVESVSSLDIADMSLKDSREFIQTDVAVLAINPLSRVFKSEELYEKQQQLKNKNYMFYDKKARSMFKHLIQTVEEDGALKALLNDKQVTIVDLFSLGSTLIRPEHILISKKLLYELQRYYPTGMISIGLVKLKPGVDVQQAVKEIKSIIPTEDVDILTYHELTTKEQRFWMRRTPAGIIVIVGMLLSIAVGIFVIYQLLYNDVSSHLGEYATLKAMGFSKWYFMRVVMDESIIVCCLGFFPAFILGFFVFKIINTQAMMPLYLHLNIVAISFAILLAACTLAGVLASIELRRADPADVF